MLLNRPRAFVLVLALLSVGLILVACSSDDGDEAADAGPAGGEVFLEPAVKAGPDPFMPTKAGNAPAAPPRKTDGAPGQESEAGIPVASEVGTTPQLYGGSGDVGVCDKAGIIDFLTENPEERAAWAGVLGISPADDVEVARYIEGLAPVVLRTDTRVTNHGYVDGQATPRQSILQAGTAVLVDAEGVPRVRCACGNPLLEPVPVSSGPTYTGEPWDGFAPERVVVVRPGPPVKVIVVINITGPGVIEVPVGDTTPTPEPSPASPPEPEPEEPTTAPEGEATNDTYVSCARRYGELVRDLTLAGIPPRPNWPADAQRAAELARDGDIAGAIRICEMTVAEMEEALAGG
ncbi:MAG: DUF6777 domain-containing protein [Miltoncostaeaceae bacterium]